MYVQGTGSSPPPPPQGFFNIPVFLRQPGFANYGDPNVELFFNVAVLVYITNLLIIFQYYYVSRKRVFWKITNFKVVDCLINEIFLRHMESPLTHFLVNETFIHNKNATGER